MQLGFQTKLSAGFTIISLLSMATCGLVSYHYAATLVRTLTIENLSNQIKGVESAISVSTADNLERQKTLITYWSKKVRSQVVFRGGEPMAVRAENQVSHEKTDARVPAVSINGIPLTTQHDFVDRIAEETGEAVTLFSRFDGGFYRVSTSVKRADGSRNVGTFIPAGSPVFEALSKGEPYSGRAPVAGAWYVTAYEPIIQDGKVVGAFFMGSPETSYARIKEYLKAQRLFDTGFFYILDSSGQMVLHPTLEGKNVLATTDVDGQKIYSDIIALKSGQITSRRLNDGTGKTDVEYSLFRYFPQMDWYVAASVRETEALAAVVRLKWILFILAAGMTSAMAVTTLLFGRQVVRRLMVISGGLVNSGEQVQLRSHALTSVSGALALASREQASSLEQTVAAVAEIRSMVAKNLEGTSITESLSQEMSTAAEDGQSLLTKMNERVLKIAEANRLLQTEMRSSHDEFEKVIEVIVGIGQKTGVINDIVFQTKLLSFNASVEAVRAGELGKGFSVVAAEVGRLASLSGAAAADIRENLESSKAQVRGIIDHVRTRSENLLADSEVQIRAGIEAANQCRESFENILVKSSKTHRAISSISIASREQDQGIDEINRAMKRMDQTTQRNSQAAEQANKLAENLRDDSGRTGDLVVALGEFLEGAPSSPLLKKSA